MERDKLSHYYRWIIFVIKIYTIEANVIADKACNLLIVDELVPSAYSRHTSLINLPS